jgi:hypothetical protein
MDPMVTTALVGTARQGPVNPATGTPIDTLIAALPEGEVERKLLLSAGALALYRQAGKQAVQIETAPEPAGPETLCACSPEAGLLLSRLLSGEQAELLPVALAKMRVAGLYMPYNLLPKALEISQKVLRTALFPVLGQRGLWLSQFNSSWNWVRNYVSDEQSAMSVEAETIWQEGTTAQRVEILCRLRSVDPAKAREWLEAVWKLEKADVRGDMLRTLEIGLHSADETFLEKALDDKAASVRTIAASVLSHLPETAFRARMLALGRNFLFLKDGMPVIKPPATYDKAWLRDGITEDPPHGLGKRAWYLTQILSCITPAFWETHLGAEPEALIAQIKTQQWGVNVLNGWSRAALLYDVSNWIRPLWNYWEEYARDPGSAKEVVTDYSLPEKLFARLSIAEAETLLLAMLSDTGYAYEKYRVDWLAASPKLWSHDFGQAYLHLFHEYLSRPVAIFTDGHENPSASVWFKNLSYAALALPASCFVEAQQGWDLPDDPSWQITYMHNELQKFVEIIHMRQKIDEEII